MNEIMAQFELTWASIVLNKELDDEKTLELKRSMLDVLNNISLHDYLSLLPASVLATLADHTVDRFTKHHILELLRKIFDHRTEDGQIFLLNHINIKFNSVLENYVLSVYFSVVARERLPGVMGAQTQIQMNPYDSYYTQTRKDVLVGDYAWGGLLHLPVTMLNFSENEIKMWKLSGRQLEFEELELKDMVFQTTETITFKDIPKYEPERASVFGSSESW